MNSRWGGILLVNLLVMLLALTTTAAGASPAYPTKAIELVVPFLAGGAADLIARVQAKHLSRELGVPVNIVNKGGGNQIPAVLSVQSAPSDGYTLLSDSPGSSSLHGVVRDLPYKIEERTFGPLLSTSPMSYCIPGKLPWKSLKDAVEAAKKDPNSFKWARLGGSSLADFGLLQFFDANGIDLRKTRAIPFQGAGPAITALAGGHVQFFCTGISGVVAFASSGDIRVLAVTGAERVRSLPDVPSSAEAGFPSLDTQFWVGLSGPKGLPKPVLDRLDLAAKKIAADPGYAKDLETIASEPRYLPPDKLRERVMNEVKQFGVLAAKYPK